MDVYGVRHVLTTMYSKIAFYPILEFLYTIFNLYYIEGFQYKQQTIHKMLRILLGHAVSSYRSNTSANFRR